MSASRPALGSARLGVEPQHGLAVPEAEARLARYGENPVAEKPPRAKWLVFLTTP